MKICKRGMVSVGFLLSLMSSALFAISNDNSSNAGDPVVRCVPAEDPWVERAEPLDLDFVHVDIYLDQVGKLRNSYLLKLNDSNHKSREIVAIGYNRAPGLYPNKSFIHFFNAERDVVFQWGKVSKTVYHIAVTDGNDSRLNLQAFVKCDGILPQ